MRDYKVIDGMDAIGHSSTYPVQLARALGMNLINQGIGGHIFDEKSLDPLIPYKPDIITVAYGTRGEVQKYLDVITPLWREHHDLVKPMGTLIDAIHTIQHL